MKAKQPRKRKRSRDSREIDFVASQPGDLLTASQVARQLFVSEGTLSVWRSTRRYPLDYLKIGSKVFYRQSDIEAFKLARTVRGAA